MNNNISYKEILAHVIGNKLYRDPSFTINRLAFQLNICVEDMQWLIRKGGKTDFKGMMNDLKIKESKRLLEESPYCGFSTEAIGRMSGFNSRKEFDTVFREKMGYWPEDYKHKIRTSTM
jgi:YesN/AraC family two-component response regulator